MRRKSRGVARLVVAPPTRGLRDPRGGVRFPAMPGSLRFRLPALFLLGIVVAGVLASVIALRLFQGYSRDSSYEELGREARGIAQLYGDAALRAAEEGSPAPDFAPQALELATGDQLFYVGAPAFPGQDSGLQRLPESAVPGAVFTKEGRLKFEFRPPGENRNYLAVSQPVRLEPDGPALGAIVVAKSGDVVRDQWLPLVGRLATAISIGALMAWLLGLWLSRRISRPIQALADASDEIASGNYTVHVPVGRGGSEVSHLSERFNEMAARLAATEERERQFLMSVSHELRTPLTAIKGHVDALRDGLIEDPELVAASLDVVANEATRLERLVGDVLDLAKLRADRFTVHTEEVDMGRLVEHAYGSFGDEARRRDIAFTMSGVVAADAHDDVILHDERGGRSPDPHHRRRPGAPGDHEPPQQRVPLDTRRRHGRARARGPERHGARRGLGHRPGNLRRRRRADLQPVRLDGYAGNRPRVADCA